MLVFLTLLLIVKNKQASAILIEHDFNPAKYKCQCKKYTQAKASISLIPLEVQGIQSMHTIAQHRVTAKNAVFQIFCSNWFNFN